MKPIVAPDVKNESQEYWEKVLDSYGLGRTKLKSEDLLDQPIIDTELNDIDGLRQIEIENE